MNISGRSRNFSVKTGALQCALLAIICLPCCSLAQQNKLTVAPPEQFGIKRGSSAPEALKVTILPGFHVNSDKPKDEYLIPLKLTWDAGPLSVKSITYPHAEEIKVGDQMLLVFTGSFDIQTEFEAPPQASPGETTISGKLRYQACNNEMCFRPMSADVRLSVVIQ